MLHSLPCRRPRRVALTLFEVTVATALLGLVVAGALDGLAAARKLRTDHDASARGMLLAQTLLAEAASLAYADPQAVSSACGLDAGESHDDPTTLDDVDDYHDYQAQPPCDRFGAELPGFAGWQVAVEVGWVDLDDPSEEASSETGLKRLTAHVASPDGVVTSLTCLRSPQSPLDQLQPVAADALTALQGELAVRGATDGQRVAVPLANQAPPSP